MDIHQLLWTIIVLAVGAILAWGVKELTAWRASSDAIDHPSLARLADIGLDIGNAALALLAKNPQLTPHDAVAWGVQELKASAPKLVAEAGTDASDTALTYMMNRKLLTAAQAAPLAAASATVISALAPSVSTARVTPPQALAVTAAVTAAAPLAIGDILSAIEARFPALSATPAAAPLPVAAQAAPVATADPSPAPAPPQDGAKVITADGSVASLETEPKPAS